MQQNTCVVVTTAANAGEVDGTAIVDHIRLNLNAMAAIAAGAALTVNGDGATVALDAVIGALKQDTRVLTATGPTDAVERN